MGVILPRCLSKYINVKFAKRTLLDKLSWFWVFVLVKEDEGCKYFTILSDKPIAGKGIDFLRGILFLPK